MSLIHLVGKSRRLKNGDATCCHKTKLVVEDVFSEKEGYNIQKERDVSASEGAC